MDQQHANRMEWEDPRNWSGPMWLGVYFSKKDTRTWVPKRIPAMGLTLNLGRTSGIVWLVGFIVGISLSIVLASVLGSS